MRGLANAAKQPVQTVNAAIPPKRNRTDQLPMTTTYHIRHLVEHTLCFAKQTLLWTVPRVRHPEQADRGTWLVILAYTMLRLAKALVRDQRLPWERSRPSHRLTPYRVRRAVSALLPHLGTLAGPPQRSSLRAGTASSSHQEGRLTVPLVRLPLFPRAPTCSRSPCRG